MNGAAPSARTAEGPVPLTTALRSFCTRHGIALAFLVLALLLFGDLLFGINPNVISAPEGDIQGQFLGWRTWAFQQWRQGEFPTWNPHIYAGAPFFAGMQAGLFYPPNWVYLWVPPVWGINFEVALHVMLLGCTTAFWARGRGVGLAGAVFAGMVATLGGPHFLHVYAGHLPNLAAMTWVPAIWWGIDRSLEAGCTTARLRTVWTTALFVALLVLAGHGQYLYYSLLASVLYLGSRFPRIITGEKGGSSARTARVAWVAAGTILGLSLAAIQLWPTLSIGKETVRNAGLPWETASMFSLPPAQLLSSFLPRFFGPTGQLPFWAPWYFWEMSLCVGTGSLALAALGLRDTNGRWRRGLLVLVVLFLILALGVHTPLYAALYNWLPGYASFRGTSKWGFYALLCLALLAGHGVDGWRTEAGLRFARVLSWFGPVAAVFLAVTAVSLRAGYLDGPWGSFVRSVGLGGGSYLAPATYNNPQFLAETARNAALNLFGAAFFLLLLGFAAWFRRLQSRWALLLPLLAVAELLAFASAFRITFTPPWRQLEQWRSFNESLPPDVRVVQPSGVNSGLLTGTLNLLGNDPFILKRYAQLIAVSQNQDPATASQYLDIRQFSPALRLLRCYGAVLPGPAGLPTLAPAPQPPLPRAFLCRKWKVEPDAGKILGAVTRPQFDPEKLVWLETAPEPLIHASDPKPTRGDQVSVVSSTPGTLTLEVQTATPAVLVMTDLWADGWRAEAAPHGALSSSEASHETPGRPTAQARYHLQPANYAVRGLPLQAGRHYIRLAYSPPGLTVGAVLSGLAALIWLVMGLVVWLQMRSGAAAARR